MISVFSPLFYPQIKSFFQNSKNFLILILITLFLCFVTFFLERRTKFWKIEGTIWQLERLGLKTIEKYLEKDKKVEPRFYRKEGPLWVDYENNYVVEREEVEGILDKLEKSQVFITGEPASGKSTVLRTVGYKLAKNNKKVFIIPFKEINRLDKKDEIININHIKYLKGYLFLDDIHLAQDKNEPLYFYNHIRERILFSGRKPGERRSIHR